MAFFGDFGDFLGSSERDFLAGHSGSFRGSFRGSFSGLSVALLVALLVAFQATRRVS